MPTMTMPGPCVICGALDYELSVGGPDICPSCDCGGFGIETVKRQGEIIRELRQRLDIAERLVRVDTALARQLSESIALNSRLRQRIAELEAHHVQATPGG
jgi:hypothetical protein